MHFKRSFHTKYFYFKVLQDKQMVVTQWKWNLRIRINCMHFVSKLYVSCFIVVVFLSICWSFISSLVFTSQVKWSEIHCYLDCRGRAWCLIYREDSHLVSKKFFFVIYYIHTDLQIQRFFPIFFRILKCI